jgi:hypothetical protein
MYACSPTACSAPAIFLKLSLSLPSSHPIHPPLNPNSPTPCGTTPLASRLPPPHPFTSRPAPCHRRDTPVSVQGKSPPTPPPPPPTGEGASFSSSRNLDLSTPRTPTFTRSRAALHTHTHTHTHIHTYMCVCVCVCVCVWYVKNIYFCMYLVETKIHACMYIVAPH